MSSVLSSISGQFTKSIILAAFLPAIIFVTAVVVLIRPLVPIQLVAPNTIGVLEALDPQWKIAAVAFAAMVVAALLYNLNIPLIQLCEGYPWQKSWLGRKLTTRYQRKLAALVRRRQALDTLVNSLDPEQDKSALAQVQAQQLEVAWQLRTSFPPDETSMLPTALGNVIRAFETYSSQQYNIEAIVLWPRLIAKLDKDFATSIDDAKMAFDFMVNGSALSGALAFLLALAGLTVLVPVASVELSIVWLVELVVVAGLAYLLYLAAVGRAAAWGDMVRGGFDLYRWDLLNQLGYTSIPKSLEAERTVWSAITQQLMFGDSPYVQLPPYSPEMPHASAAAPHPGLRIARGLLPNATKGELTVALEVYNPHETLTAMEVKVTDTPPDGYAYRSTSARIGTRPIADVVGANPLTFELPDVPPNTRLTIEYDAAATAAGK